MRRLSKPDSVSVVELLALLSFLLLTNHWLSWQGGIELLSLSDVQVAYLPMAQAAPRFLQETIPSHHAQRFFVPYAVGLFSRAVGLSAEFCFAGALAALQALILCCVFLILREQRPGRRRAILALCLLCAQPYSFRYYWIARGMLPDVLFVLGVAVLMLALLRGSAALLVLGLVLGTLGRQTAVLMLPGVAYLLGYDAGFSLRIRGWGLSAFGCLAVVGSVLWVLSAVSRSFSGAPLPLETMYGLFPWLLQRGSAGSFLEHSLRCFLPLLPTLALMLPDWRRIFCGRSLGLLMIGLGVASQPFLAGPELSGQNASRLATLGLLPLVLATVIQGGQEWRVWPFRIAVSALLLGSLHHMYSVVGPSDALQTAWLQALAGVLVMACSILNSSFANQPDNALQALRK